MSEPIETIVLKLYQVASTEKAYKFQTTDDANRGFTCWVPRSQIEHITRRPSEKYPHWPECEVTMPLWLAEDKGLA